MAEAFVYVVKQKNKSAKTNHTVKAKFNFSQPYMKAISDVVAALRNMTIKISYQPRRKTTPFRAGDISRNNLAKIRFEFYNVKKF